MRIIALVVAATSLAACAGNPAGPTDTRIVASWAQRTAVAGTTLSFTLDAEGTKVTGTGTYALENGRTGTLAITGRSSDDTVRLAFTYNNGDVAQFNGSVSEANLTGGLHFGPAEMLTPAAIVTFDRR